MKILSSVFVAVLMLQVACGNMSQSSATSPQANAANKYPNAKIQANELTAAVVAGDYVRARELTHPKVVHMMGGPESFIETLRLSRAETESDKFDVLSDVADDPQDIIVEGKNVYAIVPTTMTIKVPEGLLIGQSYLIGASMDEGKTWQFVGGGKDMNQLKIFFPTVADKLKLPEDRRPVLHRTP